MKLESDSQGFLIGASLMGKDSERMLSDIRGHTGRILAIMLRSGGLRTRAPTASPATWSAA